MTSKEFQCKCACYRPLSQAAQLFTDELICDNIYHVVCLDSVGRKFECYTAQPHLLLYGDSEITGFKYLYFDRFSISQFHVQLRYFKSFVSNLLSISLMFLILILLLIIF